MPGISKWQVGMMTEESLSSGQALSTVESGQVNGTFVEAKVQKRAKRSKQKSDSPKVAKSESGEEQVCEVDVPILDKYKILERLGKGAYGIVWECVELDTKRKVALKKIFDAFRNNMDAQRTYREVFFLLQFGHHPNIINLTGGHKAQNDLDFYLSFPLMATDLHKVIKTCPDKLGTKERREIFYEICKAIQYIHSANVIHRDLKPANILLDEQFHVKLGDFGLARSMTSGDWGKGDAHPEMTDYVATRWYRPPEILLSCRRYSKSIDIWGLGCILAEMINKRALFPGNTTIEQIELVIGTIPHPSRNELERVATSSTLTSVVQAAMMCRKPSIAETFETQGPNIVDLLEKIHVFASEKRPTIEQVLEHPFLKWDRNIWEEIRFQGVISPSIQDSVRYPLETYRNFLYTMIEKGEITNTVKPDKNYVPFEQQKLDLKRSKFSVSTLPTKVQELSDHCGDGDTFQEKSSGAVDIGSPSNEPLQMVHVGNPSDRKNSKSGFREKNVLKFEKDENRKWKEETTRSKQNSRVLNSDTMNDFSILHPKLKPYESKDVQSQSLATSVTMATKSHIPKKKPMATEDFALKLLEIQKRLDSMDVKPTSKSYDIEKGDWNLNPAKTKRPSTLKRSTTTTYRTKTDEILQSLTKHSNKNSNDQSNDLLLTFVDERPIRSRGKKPSTADTDSNVYHRKVKIAERPWTQTELVESSSLHRDSSSFNFLDDRSRSRTKGVQLETKTVPFRPEKNDVAENWRNAVSQNSTKPTTRIQQILGTEKTIAQKEREKMKRSAYFPVAELHEPCPQEKPGSKIKNGRNIHRCRITGNADINNSTLPSGLLRQEPQRTRRRSSTRPRPTTQPQSIEKYVFPPKNKSDKSKHRDSEPTVRPGNYATITSTDLNNLKATFLHVGRY